MAKYLQLDGIDDYLKTPSITFDSVEMAFTPKSSVTGKYYLDARPNLSGGYYNDHDGLGGGWTSIYVNGVLDGSRPKLFTVGQKVTLKLIAQASATGVIPFFCAYWYVAFMQVDVYSIKVYNAGTLVAYYDMSTGTVQDQSGNGNHATLIGGTWVNDAPVSTTINLAGSITSVSTVSANLNVAKNLAGSISATSSANASLTVTGVNNLSGAIASSSTVSADLSVTKALSGSVAGTSSISAALTVIVGINLSGNINAISSVRGGIQSIINLIGNVGLKSSVTASLFVLKTSITYGDIENVVYKKLNTKTYRYLSAMPFFAPIVSSVNLELVQKYSENLKFITKYSESLKFIEKYTVNLKINSVYSTKMEVSDV